jgi:glyoxylase-like metal-dependent hydrolase (beta-lactamase superfamily II)
MIQGGNPEVVYDGPVPIYYIRATDDLVLIDTSFHFDDAEELGIRDAVSRKLPDEDPILALEKEGIKPEHVTKLILTHAHIDHVGYVDAFPNAEIYMHRKELAWVMALPPWAVGYGEFAPRKIYKVRKQLRPIDGDHMQILPGIEVMYVGGHSPGSLAVLVDTKDGRVCLCIDNCFLFRNISEKIPIELGYNIFECMAFLEKLPSLADIHVPGHDPQLYERFPGGVIA